MWILFIWNKKKMYVVSILYLEGSYPPYSINEVLNQMLQVHYSNIEDTSSCMSTFVYCFLLRCIRVVAMTTPNLSWLTTIVSIYIWHVPSRFSRYSEANASEFLENIWKIFSRYFTSLLIINIYIAIFFEVTQSATLHVHMK